MFRHVVRVVKRFAVVFTKRFAVVFAKYFAFFFAFGNSRVVWIVSTANPNRMLRKHDTSNAHYDNRSGMRWGNASTNYDV